MATTANINTRMDDTRKLAVLETAISGITREDIVKTLYYLSLLYEWQVIKICRIKTKRNRLSSS